MAQRQHCAAVLCRLQLHLITIVACCSLVCGVHDRSAAFIGYTEKAGYGHCQDKHRTCEHDASVNKCLTDPYNMRRVCPFSCNVEPCTNPGTYLEKFVFKGHASKRGTELYAGSLLGSVGINHFQRVQWGLKNITEPDSEPMSLKLSSLGLGTYLGAADDATDEQVLSAVLYSATRGWNVIDTAPNYRDGRAEASIGRALLLLLVGSKAEEFPEGRAEVTRDALFISSKAGFLNSALKQQLLEQGAASSTDLMAGSHCLSRACIRASVKASLAALRLETLDLLYLHNAAEVQLLARGRVGFMALLKEAFQELEALRQEGKVRGYGMATWECFRQPPNSHTHLSLEEVVNLAREVGGKQHGFLAVQLPVNAKLTEAFMQPWQLVLNQTATDAVRKAAAAAAAAQAAAEAALRLKEPEDVDPEKISAAMDQGLALPPPPPPSPPPPPPPAVYDSVTLLEAAKRMGVAVFASGPLLEGQLLQGLVGPLDGIMGLKDARSTAGKLLQYARSVPGVASVLLGQKAQEHVEANVPLAAMPRLAEKMWELVKQEMEATLKQQQQKAVTV